MQAFQTEPTTDLLRRCPHRRMVGGVAAGAADYLGVDLTAVRVVLVALTIFGGFAVPLYVAAWLLLPDEDSDTSIAEQVLQRVIQA